MKKIFIFLSLSALFMYGCQDIHDKFDGLDDMLKPVNKTAYEYTIADADIATIVSATRGTADEAYAKQLQTDKMFSALAPADKLIPYLMAKKYYTADPGSSAKVTYQFKANRDDVVSGISTSQDNPAYILGNADYKAVWGDPFAGALTPAKSPTVELPKLLLAKYPDAESGAYKVIAYNYSEDEPEVSVVETKFVSEDLENNPSGAGTGKKVDVAGWLNVDLAGTYSWECRNYSNNNYAQVSSYKSTGLNDIWLIAPQADLTNATNPFFSFDIVTGNYNVTCLKVLISENFDGTQANILTATWVDVTSSFTLPTPASGYSAWGSAGTLSLDSYKGKKIYVAFRYEGDDVNTPKKTTTYQLDNIKVYNEEVGIAVEKKEVQYAVYQNTSGVWKPAASYVIVLQPEDYVEMGLSGGTMTVAQASVNLPIYLAKKYPYASVGDDRVIVYKTGSSSFYADRVNCVDVQKWELESFVEPKTEQFMLSTIGWVFDPTFVVTMVKGKAETDDYMIVVNYVKANQAVETPALLNSYGDAEFYYGFNANYGNITFRDKDRAFDPTYPSTGTDQEKLAFCKDRTVEALGVYLGLKYPNAQPLVNGIEQKAKVTCLIYYGPASSNVENFEYELQCTGDKEWKFLQRKSLLTGEVEEAETEE